MAQVELSVPLSCVDLIDANELPVPGIPGNAQDSTEKARFRGESGGYACITLKVHPKPLTY